MNAPRSAHPVSIVGLGVMGQRMMRNMTRYAGFHPIAAWDPDDAARERTRRLYPDVRICRSAEEAIDADGCAVVYVACPPAVHHEHVLNAFACGRAVFCEKPLGVDNERSRELVERADTTGLTNIVNYTLASAPAAVELGRRVRSGQLGEVVGADLRLHFRQWPENWQIGAASWLDYRQQGGFVREVVSHWIFLTERLFGAARLEDAWIRYPSGDTSESHVHAALVSGEVPVTVAGSVGGRGPDLFEYTVWGTRESARILDWCHLRTSTGDGWTPELRHIADPREAGYEAQLDDAARAVAGEPHTMPSFADALSVQRLIEAMVSS